MGRIIRAQQAEKLSLKEWQPGVLANNFGDKGNHPGFATLAAGTRASAASETEAAQITAQAYQQGLEEGRAIARQESQAKLEELDRRGDEMEAERRLFFDKVEPELARLAVGIAEKVIAKELETNPEIVIGLVRNAMKRMREREMLRVRLNPEDLPLVKAAREDLIAEVNGVNKLDLQEDRRVARGGCMVESSNGILDATIKTQLEKLEEVITEASDAGDRKDH